MHHELVEQLDPSPLRGLRETTGRSRSPYSCPHRSQVETGGQRGALGVVWLIYAKYKSGYPMDNLHLSVDS